MVIGKQGAEVDKVKEELKKITGKDVQINIFEIKRPEIDAKLIGEAIASQLQARISFRRAMKQAIASAMRVGAQGIKLKLSGRLGVLKWLVLKDIRRVVFHCIPYVPMWIMPFQKL